MDELLIREVDLPYNIKGGTVPDENGDYNIYINKRLSPEGKVKAYRHEIAHILSGHFSDDTLTVEEKERNGNTEENEVRELDDSSLHWL